MCSSMRPSASVRVKVILDFQYISRGIFRDFLKQFFWHHTLVVCKWGSIWETFFSSQIIFFRQSNTIPKLRLKKIPESILTYILLTFLLIFQPDGDCGIKGKIRVAEIIGGLLVNFIISIGQVVHVIIDWKGEEGWA